MPKQQTARKNYYQERLAQARGAWKPTDYSARLLVPDNTIMVLADVHLPRHDESLLAEAFVRAERERVGAIVFLGDLMDMPTFSSWGLDDWSSNFKRELGMVRTVIQCALEAAPAVYWSMGNHEMRFMRKLDMQIELEDLARLVGLDREIDECRLIISDNPTLDAFGGAWMLTHPKAYGKQPLVEPGKIATRFQQHIISAHAHHHASGLDETGMFQVVESGGLFQPKFHKYIQHNVTAHRAWVQGYWIIDEGVATGFTPNIVKLNVSRPWEQGRNIA